MPETNADRILHADVEFKIAGKIRDGEMVGRGQFPVQLQQRIKSNECGKILCTTGSTKERVKHRLGGTFAWRLDSDRQEHIQAESLCVVCQRAANAPGGIGNPTGPVRLLQQVTLSPDGKHYSGTFTLDAYDISGTQVAHIVGVVAATRITIDTTVEDIL